MAKREKNGVQTKGTAPLPPPDPTFFQTLRLRVNKDPFTKPYSQHVWVYACALARAQAIGSVPFRLMERTKAASAQMKTASGRRDVLFKEIGRRVSGDDIEYVSILEDPKARLREVKRLAPWLHIARLMRAVGEIGIIQSGPWFEVFRDVNPLMTKSQLWEATVIYLGLGGECFWVLEGAGNGPIGDSEVPTEIWPYGREGWSPKMNETTMLPERWKFEYMVNGRTVEKLFDNTQLIRARNIDPANVVRGVGAVDAVRAELEASWKAMQFNKAVFDNGGSPGGYLYSDKPLTPQKRKELLDEWEERHTGPRKAGRPDVLSGLKFVESGITHRDMQYTEMLDRVRDAVLAAFRTPKSQIGLVEDVNRASAHSARRTWWESTLLPVVGYLEDLMDSDLFTVKRNAANVIGIFDVSTVEALREDLSQKTAVAKDMVDIGYPVNAVNSRLELGMDDVEWGDAWWRSGTLVPQVSEPDDPQEAIETEEDTGNEIGGEPNGQGNEDGSAAGDSTGADGADGTPTDSSGKALKRSVYKTEDHWESLVQRILGPGEQKFKSRYKKFLFDLRRAQLKKIEEAGSTTNTGQILFPLRYWQDELVKQIRPVYKKIYEAAAKEMQEELERLRKAAPAAVVKGTDGKAEVYIDSLGRRIEKSVSTIRKRLERNLNDAVEKGLTKDELADIVRGTFNDIDSGGKIDVIASTETAGTVNGARQIVMRAAGLKQQEWLTAGDELVRDTHVLYGNGGPQDLGFNYAELSKGADYKLLFPGDPSAPPAETVNCRCVLVPVGDSSEDDLTIETAPKKINRRMALKPTTEDDVVLLRVKVPKRRIATGV